MRDLPFRPNKTPPAEDRARWVTVWAKPKGAPDTAFERAGDCPSLIAAIEAVSARFAEKGNEGLTFQFMPYYMPGTRCRNPLPSEDFLIPQHFRSRN